MRDGRTNALERGADWRWPGHATPHGRDPDFMCAASDAPSRVSSAAAEVAPRGLGRAGRSWRHLPRGED